MKRLLIFLVVMLMSYSHAANPSFQSFNTNAGFKWTGPITSPIFIVDPAYIGTNSASPITNQVAITGVVAGNGSNTITVIFTISGSNYVYDMIQTFAVNPTNGLTAAQAQSLINASLTTNQITITNSGVLQGIGRGSNNVNVPNIFSQIGTQAIQSIAGSSSTASNAFVLKTNGFATKLTYNSSRLLPTNIYTFGLISCSNIASGGVASAWYSPNHAWSNMMAGSISLVGDQFAIGNDQYHIVGVSNGNDSIVFAIPYGTPPQQGYTNVSAIYYPITVRMDDINGKQCGYLGSAGDHGFIDTDSSGANATEDMIIIEKTNAMTFRLYRRAGTFVGGVKFSTLKGLVGSDPIDIDINAPYESFEVFESGLIGARFGFTNVFGTGIWIDQPIFTNSFQAYSKSKAGAGTVTSAADNRTIDCSGANFGALKIGDVFIVGGASYTIRGIVDSDTIQVIEDLTPGFIAQPWSTVPASHTFNESPTVTAWSSERGMGVNTIQSGDGPSLYILGGTGQTNAFSVRYTSHGANVGILAFISTITGGDIFDIDGHAPYESFEIIRDGKLQVRDGFTNYFGVPITFYSAMAQNTNGVSFNFPIIQSGSTNLSVSSGVVVNFAKAMPGTNYTVAMTGQGAAALAAPLVTAKTVNNFTTTMTAFTGNLDWTATMNTQ